MEGTREGRKGERRRQLLEEEKERRAEERENRLARQAEERERKHLEIQAATKGYEIDLENRKLDLERDRLEIQGKLGQNVKKDAVSPTCFSQCASFYRKVEPRCLSLLI